MKLKTANYIMVSTCVLMVLLIAAGSYTKNRGLLLSGIVVAFLGMAFWIIFGRCPSCGKYLGRTNGKHCPHCGEKIDW